MRLANIRLQQFRSYEDQAFEFEPSVNIVIGPNASGKTNLLEAILMVCRGRSYKTTNPAELINHKKPWARIDAMFDADHTRSLKLIREPTPSKLFEIDNQEKKRLSYQDNVPTVLFEPAQLFLLTSSPEIRRNFIDDILEQTATGFGAVRRSYLRTLKQRNSLLKSSDYTRAKQEVFAWNIRLSESAGEYVEYRLKLIERLNKNITKHYNHIASAKHKLLLSYQTTANTDNYASTMLQKLEQSFTIDHARGFTTSGPHRDDISLQIDKHQLKETASRGEVRTALLALKLTEANLIEKDTSQQPLFLLDDVFGELDGARRHALTDFLKNHQAFITTTDADVVTHNFAKTTNQIVL